MKDLALYTLARLGLFVAAYAAVAGAYVAVTGNRQLPLVWPFLVALVASSVASVYLLRGMRDRLTESLRRRAGGAGDEDRP